MKLCKDCIWHELDTTEEDKEDQLKYARCDCPKNMLYTIDLVSGKDIVKRTIPSCQHQRTHKWIETRTMNLCGKEGRWYERSNM